MLATGIDIGSEVDAATGRVRGRTLVKLHSHREAALHRQKTGEDLESVSGSSKAEHSTGAANTRFAPQTPKGHGRSSWLKALGAIRKNAGGDSKSVHFAQPLPEETERCVPSVPSQQRSRRSSSGSALNGRPGRRSTYGATGMDHTSDWDGSPGTLLRNQVRGTLGTLQMAPALAKLKGPQRNKRGQLIKAHHGGNALEHDLLGGILAEAMMGNEDLALEWADEDITREIVAVENRFKTALKDTLMKNPLVRAAAEAAKKAEVEGRQLFEEGWTADDMAIIAGHIPDSAWDFETLEAKLVHHRQLHSESWDQDDANQKLLGLLSGAVGEVQEELLKDIAEYDWDAANLEFVDLRERMEESTHVNATKMREFFTSLEEQARKLFIESVYEKYNLKSKDGVIDFGAYARDFHSQEREDLDPKQLRKTFLVTERQQKRQQSALNRKMRFQMESADEAVRLGNEWVPGSPRPWDEEQTEGPAWQAGSLLERARSGALDLSAEASFRSYDEAEHLKTLPTMGDICRALSRAFSRALSHHLNRRAVLKSARGARIPTVSGARPLARLSTATISLDVKASDPTIDGNPTMNGPTSNPTSPDGRDPTAQARAEAGTKPSEACGKLSDHGGGAPRSPTRTGSSVRFAVNVQSVDGGQPRPTKSTAAHGVGLRPWSTEEGAHTGLLSFPQVPGKLGMQGGALALARSRSWLGPAANSPQQAALGRATTSPLARAAPVPPAELSTSPQPRPPVALRIASDLQLPPINTSTPSSGSPSPKKPFRRTVSPMTTGAKGMSPTGAKGMSPTSVRPRPPGGSPRVGALDHHKEAEETKERLRFRAGQLVKGGAMTRSVSRDDLAAHADPERGLCGGDDPLSLKAHAAHIRLRNRSSQLQQVA